MTRKVLNIAHGRYWCECIMDDSSAQPYKLYKVSFGYNKYGYPAKHRELVAKYADFASVLVHVGLAAKGTVDGLFD